MESTLMTKIVGLIRIALGAAMIYFGVTKIGASEQMIQFIGGAGHAMGLDFLSVQTWFWIALIGELLAGVLLLVGYKTTRAAILVLIIMLFAANAMERSISTNLTLVTIGALIILWQGHGDRAVDAVCEEKHP